MIPQVARVDQMSAWAFVALGMAAFAGARAGRLFSMLHGNRGGMDLFGILTLVVFLLIVIFAVRRRQVNAWRSSLHVMAALVAGNALAIALIWPFVPGTYDLSLAPLLRETLFAGAVMTLASLPLSVLLLWLSRKYGSHSALTERRFRVIREVLQRRRERLHGDDGPR